jgi:hypothetical protein
VRIVALATLPLLAVAPPAPIGIPPHGLFVPGKSFGGLRLGASEQQVKAVWGRDFGRCLCAEKTWYFNYKKYEPQGTGVTFRNHRAVALFTQWSPPGWRTPQGLTIGDRSARVRALYGKLILVRCGPYSALVRKRGDIVTSYYVYARKVWGFGLSRPGVRLCR